MDFYKQYQSGLRLVAVHMDCYTVSLGVFVDVGCVREDKAHNGYSHFIEHLVFKGTDVLSDMYFNASVPQEELEREKGVVTEEIKMCEDTPDDVSQDLVSAALFYGQPLGQTILGSIDNIRRSDRQSILNFKRAHYVPTATVVAVCGKFDDDALDKLVQRYFENHCEKSLSVPDAEPREQYHARFLHKFKQTEQAHLQLAWGGFSLKDGERFANNMLASVLGGGLSSRLNQVIREQHGLAYSVYAYPSYYVNCGTFEIYMGLSPENSDKACRLVKEQIDRLVCDGITPRELERARMQAVNALYMNVESNMTLMRLYGRSMLKLNERFDVEKEVSKYRLITVSDVNNVARHIFAQPHASAYVGPKVDGYNAVSQIKFDVEKTDRTRGV